MASTRGVDVKPTSGGDGLHHRRTRIVATLGPASASRARIRALLEAGVDVVRLNFSHGEPAAHARALNEVRRAAKRLGRHIPVLADLAGPKMRVGRFAGGAIELSPGTLVRVTARNQLGRPGLIPSQYRRLARDVRPGDPLLLDDGNIELRVRRVLGADVDAEVVVGGKLSDHKGMNLPGSAVSAPSLTASDRRNAAFALAMGVDYLALSFVRRARDVLSLRSLLRQLGRPCPIIAKIEKPQALDDLAAILRVADAVMVARGDLGVELPPERVPIAQREIVSAAIAAGRPVIIATQMLESMTARLRPTRAEANDVASAVFASADAVMLSGETAAGRYPVESVRMMDRILREVEKHQWRSGGFRPGGAELPSDGPGVAEAFARAIARLSWDTGARCLVVPAEPESAVLAVAADRPEPPILAVSPDAAVCRRLSLSFGVIAVQQRLSSRSSIEVAAEKLARRLGFVARGQTFLLVWCHDSRGAATGPAVRALVAR